MAQRWGASPADWRHFSTTLGLTSELLPYVANPKASIAPYSKLKRLGKTPTVYNRSGEVHGFVKWQEHQTTSREIERWAADGDLGICLQGRRIRAWDIDVPDRAKSRPIADAIMQLGGVLPIRSRPDSGKVLLACAVEGDWFKDVLQVDGGKIEFLAEGQQFLVVGRHEDGARYGWDAPGGLPEGFPVWSVETVESVKAALEMAFGDADGWSASAGRGARRRGSVGDDEDPEAEDEIATWLVENWPTYGVQGEKLFVQCPWKDVDHSGDSGETEAAWLLRGTRGYEQGHFRCLHGHCQKRGREEFLAKVGWVQSGFDVIEAESAKSEGINGHSLNGTALAPADLPNFDRKKGVTNRNGIQIIRAVLDNLVMACERPDVCGVRLAYDSFREEKLIAGWHENEWRPFKDVDEVRIRKHLERGGFEAPIAHKLMKDAILDVADANAFDSALQWLEGLPPWDGVERCPKFMTTYMGTADTPYASAIGLYAWTAHAGRVLVPGIKADMVIALTGPQGQRKSGAIAAIAPKDDYATELNLHKDDVELARQMRGVLVAEIPELRGLNSRGADVIRAWITARQEKWAHKFEEHATIFRRRLVFWSTANDLEFLADSTGERRWLPIEVERMCDEDGLVNDRDQLWAEGLWRFRHSGVAWEEAERLAKGEHGRFKVTDEWDAVIQRWLTEEDLAGKKSRLDGGFTGIEVAQGALGLDVARYGKSDQMRIGKVLRSLGYASILKRDGDGPSRTWQRVRFDL